MPRKSARGRSENGNGSIRKKTVTRNGKKYEYWELRYTAGYDALTGKQIQRSITGTSREDVQNRYFKIKADADCKKQIPSSGTTVEDFLTLWFDTYIEPNSSSSTKYHYEAIIRLHLIPNIGHIKLSELNAFHIQTLYTRLLRIPLSAKYVHDIHGVLHEALKQGVMMELIPRNPADMVKPPKVVRKEFAPFTDDDMKRYLQEIHGTQFEHLLYVAPFTGVRMGEILGLTWDCVDFEHNQITINKQLQYSRISKQHELTPTKNRKGRIVTVAPSVMIALRRQKTLQATYQLAAGPFWDNPNNLVFTNETGRCLTQDSVRRRFKAVVSAIGRPELRFHDLRHFFAVASLENGDDIKTVQQNLGHASAGFTLDVYGHVSEKMRTQSAQRMEHFIESVSAK